MKKIIFGIVVLVVGVLGFVSFKAYTSNDINTEGNYQILQKWDLPEDLNEISGITWLEEDRIACVQDEDGSIFIYNLQTSKIEKKIDFAGKGDYEGIAVIHKDAYILRSDGVIFQVEDFMEKDFKTKEHVTRTNKLPGINLEGLCADDENKRLLLAVKEGKDFEEQKGIFSFDLTQNNSFEKALFHVKLEDPIFKKVKGKLKDKFSPGEIGIHPKTGEYFILDGTRAKILITDKDGTPGELLMLGSRDFENPEGLTFSPQGDLYISNEAESGPANILKVALTRETK